MADLMVDIRCRGCLGYVGIGPGDFRVYHDVYCAEDYAVTSAEDRDALIEVIFQTQNKVKSALAQEFGISRQRVDQILTMRSYQRS